MLQYCCVHVNTDQLLTYAGHAFEPAAYGSLSCIALLGGEKNEPITKELYAFLEDKLGIKSSR